MTRTDESAHPAGDAHNDFLDYNNSIAAFGYITDMTQMNSVAQAPCVSSAITDGTSHGFAGTEPDDHRRFGNAVSFPVKATVLK